jgi:hypothetical protein
LHVMVFGVHLSPPRGHCHDVADHGHEVILVLSETLVSDESG